MQHRSDSAKTVAGRHSGRRPARQLQKGRLLDPHSEPGPGARNASRPDRQICKQQQEWLSHRLAAC